MTNHIPTPVQLAWAAGFIDGEGCFYVGRPKQGSWRIAMTASQNVRGPLDLLRDMFDAGTVHRSDGRAWQWLVAGARRLNLIVPMIRPYLVAKADTADAFMAIVHHAIGGEGRRLGEDGHAERAKLVEVLKGTRTTTACLQQREVA